MDVEKESKGKKAQEQETEEGEGRGKLPDSTEPEKESRMEGRRDAIPGHSGHKRQTLDRTGGGLKIPLWKKEPGELDQEAEEGDNEEEEDSDEKDSDEAEKTSQKEGEYWESQQEFPDVDGNEKGSVSYSPLHQESSVPEVPGLRRSKRGFWTWLSPLTLLFNLSFPVDRKRILPGVVCLREKQRSNDWPCSRCEILFCRKCETLHCDPNYVKHCVSDQEELEGEQISPSQETVLFMNPPVTEDIQ